MSKSPQSRGRLAVGFGGAGVGITESEGFGYVREGEGR